MRLLHGPISVDFLAQPIERAIAEEVATVGVAIEDVALRLGDGGQIEFELKNVRVTDADNVRRWRSRLRPRSRSAARRC